MIFILKKIRKLYFILLLSNNILFNNIYSWGELKGENEP